MISRRTAKILELLSIFTFCFLVLFILCYLITGNWHAFNAVVGWISSFMRSAGFGGLCALLAARIAWSGVQKQVEVSWKSISQQGDVERDKSWWSRLEWIAENGLSAVGERASLPAPVTIIALNELANVASDDVQRKTVSSMIDELAVTSAQSSNTEPRSDVTEREQERTNQALVDYAENTQNTAAESPIAALMRYERAFNDAVINESIASSRAPLTNDVGTIISDSPVLDIGGVRVAVQLLKYGRLGERRLTEKVRQLSRMISDQQAELGIFVVSPDDPNFNGRAAEYRIRKSHPNIRIIEWSPEEGSPSLAKSIKSAIRR